MFTCDKTVVKFSVQLGVLGGSAISMVYFSVNCYFAYAYLLITQLRRFYFLTSYELYCIKPTIFLFSIVCVGFFSLKKELHHR